MTTFVSSTCLGGGVIAKLITRARALDIHAIELTAGVLADGNSIGSYLRAAGTDYSWLVHNYFPPPATPFVLNLASLNADVHSASIAHCQKAIRLAAELGAPFYSVHCGFGCDPRPEDLGRALTAAPRFNLDSAWQRFVTSLDVLCGFGRDVGVRILVENNVLTASNLVGGENVLLLGVTADELVRIVKAVGSPWLGVLVDVGHLKVSATTLGFDRSAFLRLTAEYVGALHLSENNGIRDSNEPFGADAWFLPELGRFRELVRVVECRASTPEEIRQCMNLTESACLGEFG